MFLMSRPALVWKGGTWTRNIELFRVFLKKNWGTEAASVKVKCMNDIPLLEILFQIRKVLYELNLVDKARIAGCAGRSDGNQSHTERLVRYTSHICYISNVTTLFETYRFWSCDIFFSIALFIHLVCHTTTKHKYPKNVKQLRETQCHKLD